MEKKFINKAQLGVDLSDGSDNTGYSLIVIADNEEDFKKKIKIMSHAPEMLEFIESFVSEFSSNYVLDGKIAGAPSLNVQSYYCKAKQLIRNITE